MSLNITTPSPLQQLKIRSSQGCWTCRLRRKKCDETKPVCAVCAALEITCHFSDAKPEWMDGGAREKVAADELKAMVKAKANDRRERKWLMQPPPLENNEPVSASAVPVPVPVVATTAIPTIGSATTDNDNMLSQNMRTSMALGSSRDNTDHEMSGISPEAGPSSVSSYSAGAGSHHQQQHQHDSSSSATGLTPFTVSSPKAPQMGAFAQPSPFTIPTCSTDSMERDTHFVMIYLDYVMPFLFPFYRPSIGEFGRGWLLVLLMKNKALFHTALSLASYFFSVALEDRDPHYAQQQTNTNGNNNNNNDSQVDKSNNNAIDNIDPAHRTACQEANWRELQTQTELAIRQLQHDMRELNGRGIAATPLMDGVRCLESIIQLLQFESAIAATDASENWPVHLDAATALFRELIAHHNHNHADTAAVMGDGIRNGIVAPGPWTAIFRRMGHYQLDIFSTQDPAQRRRGPFSSDQSAFRFYTAYLVWADVVASTARGEAPRLQEFHEELLGCGRDGSGLPQLILEDYIGCRSWAVRLLGEVAALAAWKKERRAASSLSIIELVQRASCIESRLRQGLADLEPASAFTTTTTTTTNQSNSNSNSNTSPLTSSPSSINANCPTVTDPLDTYTNNNSNNNGGSIFFAVSPDASASASASTTAQAPLPRPLHRDRESRNPPPLAALHTRIWAQATLTYLAVTVHGYQPRLAEIAGSAAETLALLRILARRQGGRGSLDLRTLAWPFAVAGCCIGGGVGVGVGEGEGEGETEADQQRLFFVNAVESMGSMRIFGTVGEALDVVRRVWELRDAGCVGGDETAESCDIASCLSVLGHRVLLV